MERMLTVLDPAGLSFYCWVRTFAVRLIDLWMLQTATSWMPSLFAMYPCTLGGACTFCLSNTYLPVIRIKACLLSSLTLPSRRSPQLWLSTAWSTTSPLQPLQPMLVHGSSTQPSLRSPKRISPWLGIVCRSNSPYASPLHLVAKAYGGCCHCGDFRRLNNVTTPDRYPILYIQVRRIKCLLFQHDERDDDTFEL